MRSLTQSAIGALSLAAITSPLTAEFVGVYITAQPAETLPNVTLVNHTTFQLYAVFDDPEDRLLGFIETDLEFVNELYQSPFGSFFPPGPSGDQGVIENLAADSWVTIGIDGTPSPIGYLFTNPMFDPQLFDYSDQLVGGWSVTPAEDLPHASVGDAGLYGVSHMYPVLFMQVTVSNDGELLIPPGFTYSGWFEDVSDFVPIVGVTMCGWSDRSGDGQPVLHVDPLCFNVTCNYLLSQAPPPMRLPPSWPQPNSGSGWPGYPQPTHPPLGDGGDGGGSGGSGGSGDSSGGRSGNGTTPGDVTVAPQDPQIPLPEIPDLFPDPLDPGQHDPLNPPDGPFHYESSD